MQYIEIKDYFGKINSVPVSDEVYEAWQDLNRAEDRLRKREQYHRDFRDPDSAEVAMQVSSIDGILDEIIRKEDTRRLYEAIEKLSAVQRRRVLMYMNCMSYTEVARHENVSVTSVYQNINGAFKRLRKLLSE